jgi:PHD/YefM family antitoxin component YafN of YafNO toxin-antitoxin module
MMRISAGDCQRQWAMAQDLAMAEPLIITANGRDRAVLMSAREYERLKRRDRRVMTLDDFTGDDIEALERVRPTEAAMAFDDELKD